MLKVLLDGLIASMRWIVVDHPVIGVGLVGVWLAYSGYRDRKVESYKDVVAARLIVLTRREANGEAVDYQDSFRYFPRIPRQPGGWFKRRAQQLRRWWGYVSADAQRWRTVGQAQHRGLREEPARRSRVYHFRLMLAVRRPEIGTFDVTLLWRTGPSRADVINGVLAEFHYGALPADRFTHQEATVLRLERDVFLLAEPALRRHRQSNYGRG